MNRAAFALSPTWRKRQEMNKAFNGELLALARQTRKVSQPELVRALNGGISQAQLSKIEHGQIQPDEKLRDKLALALKYRPDFFCNPVYQRMDPVSFHRTSVRRQMI
jgi:transcriptional regulator with XRE-family HTH domain